VLVQLIRLAEARARIELREVVTRDDAIDAIEVTRGNIMSGTDRDFVVTPGIENCSGRVLPFLCAL
jgi:DNA replicative helicase MCM subunit Mcm2 (Cdc46/Mcm family)